MSDDYQRHSELIDKMFFGLTSDESEELRQIRERADLEGYWYAPIIRKFERLYPDDPALGSIPVMSTPVPASDAKGNG